MTPHVIAVEVGFGLGFSALWTLSRGRGRALARRTMASLRRRPAPTGFKAIRTDTLPWVGNRTHRDLVSYAMKPLLSDVSSGLVVMLVRYPPGEVYPPHTHPVGHGFYVLEGSLVTHRGTFGPGSFVWIPAGETMTHGAGPDQELVTLFVTERGSRTDMAPPAAGDAPPRRD